MLKIDSENFYALLGLSNILISKGEFDKCLSLIDDLVYEKNNSIYLELLKIKVHLKKKKEDKLLLIIDNLFTILKN